VRLAGDAGEIAQDEQALRDAATFLTDMIIPALANDLLLAPDTLDSSSLLNAFHQLGVNMRYLGKLISLLPLKSRVSALCVREVVARGAKHVLNRVRHHSSIA